MAGKGSSRRPSKEGLYNAGWARIFGRGLRAKQEDEAKKAKNLKAKESISR
tara:strand:+ start:2221 stop:2373 length:153 start_codon:yes stop_codon:yes gene_type:complete